MGEGLHPGPDTISTLAPEEQAGIEGGVDLLLGQIASIQITRFDQTASGLIQRVGVPYDTVIEGVVRRRAHYPLQNVGEIGNRGWELQGSVQKGPLTVAGTFTFVDSRVNQAARTYTGDLRQGDRMLGVPKRTMSGSVIWSGTHWSSTVTAYRANDWIYYDRLTLAQLAAANQSVTGTALRRYWLWYGGVTHLRATLTRDLWRGFSVLLTGDNLLNKQTGEPDNSAVLPGRTVTFGLRGQF
jgi:iron complex outermembrane receptor protein